MPEHIADSSVDLILADLPYGTTRCVWDTIIPLDRLWEEYKRVIKPGGAIVLFASQPFTSALVMSNPGMLKYDLVWDKRTPVGHLTANIRPLRKHETILVFGDGRTTYVPQKTTGKLRSKGGYGDAIKPGVYGDFEVNKLTLVNDQYYPTSILEIPAKRSNLDHPTEKPVPLLEYLIRTYSNPGELVLDNTMGSGSTGEACISTGRDFVGMELYPLPAKPVDPVKNPDYFYIAQRRLEEVAARPKQLAMFGEGT